MLAPTGPTALAREPLRGLNWKEQTHGSAEESGAATLYVSFDKEAQGTRWGQVIFPTNDAGNRHPCGEITLNPCLVPHTKTSSDLLNILSVKV